MRAQRSEGRRCSCERLDRTSACDTSGEPGVRAFHHPTPGFEPSFSFDGLGLLAPAADVSGEAKLVQRSSHLVKVVAFIQALHTLGLVWTGRRSRHGQAVHRGPHQFHVMTVRPVHRQTHRNALGASVNRLRLTPPLPRSVGLGPVFRPRPRAIWSWRRPYSANSSPAPSVRHSETLVPTAPRTPQRQPIH